MSQANCNKCQKPITDGEVSERGRCSRCKSAVYCSLACQSDDWPSHKTSCRRENYVIKFHLLPDIIADPPVVRTLDVPATTTFAKLHYALQAAFGWADTHTYDFAVRDPNYDDSNETMADYISMMMTGRTADMPREFELRICEQIPQTIARIKIDQVHEKRRQHPNTVEKKAPKVKIYQLFDDPKYAGKVFEYTYDFGDGWTHEFTVERRSPGTDIIQCLDGSGHGVAEDVKRDGWADLKEAYRTSNPNKKQRENRQWYETMASNGNRRGLGGGREHFWDKDEINRRLQREV